MGSAGCEWIKGGETWKDMDTQDIEIQILLEELKTLGGMRTICKSLMISMLI